jgi:hypothetical protein
VQQSAAELPTTPTFAASLNLLAPQTTLFPPHLVLSGIQQIPLSPVASHFKLWQCKLAWFERSVVPAEHANPVHFFPAVQQL